MVAALTFTSILASLTSVFALAIRRQSPNPAHTLASRAVSFPEGCDVVCNWEGDKPELPECTWELCLANIEKTTCTQTEIESTDDNTDEARFNSVYSIFLYGLQQPLLLDA